MATTVTLSMKLLINKTTQRVLFAEAGKDVVDFLFSLLALPIATAVKLLGTDAMVGCVGNLYTSVDKLSSTYIQPGAARDALLCSTVVSPNSSFLGLTEKTLYKCTNLYNNDCRSYITSVYGRACPTCVGTMTAATKHLSSASGQAVSASSTGFVQGVVTYMVRDDLTVTAMSAVSSITLLNTFAVRDIGNLEEKKVQLGYSEGLAILKASLQSKSVLTDVFLHGINNNKPPAGGRA